MKFIWIVPIILATYYLYLISKYLYYWYQLPIWSKPKSLTAPTLLVSVIIPARNEEKNIAACLSSLKQQNYPTHLLEIILLDDHSEDATVAIAQSLYLPNLRILSLSLLSQQQEIKNSFKKAGLQCAIEQSRGALIVTTDADCVVPSNWVANLVAFHLTHNSKFIAAPVNFYLEKNQFERFQSLDFIGMQLITGAGVQGDFMRMCNGANLAFTKQVFMEVGGYEGIQDLASGDDMLLLQKVAQRYPQDIAYLKSSTLINKTQAAPTLKDFYRQRLRWASKSSHYPERQVIFMLAMTFFYCWSILLSLLLIPFIGKTAFFLFIFQFLLKSIMDYFLLREATRFFNRPDLMKGFLLSQCMHILYVAIIGLAANIQKKYIWKERLVQ